MVYQTVFNLICLRDQIYLFRCFVNLQSSDLITKCTQDQHLNSPSEAKKRSTINDTNPFDDHAEGFRRQATS